MTYFCITINAHPHSGWFCVKHYLISLKRISIALHELKPHNKKARHCCNKITTKSRYLVTKPDCRNNRTDDRVNTPCVQATPFICLV